MTEICKLALVGIGGYGNIYLHEIMKRQNSGIGYELVAGIDPSPKNCEYLSQLRELGITVYDNLTDMYKDHSPNVVIISAPVHHHAELACVALSQNSDVLCEKPLASCIGDILRIERSEKVSGRQVAVGYQWSFTNPIQRCKSDIIDGKFGRPIRAKAIAISSRNKSYFKRNNWAGRIKTDDGHWVLDSPLNNAHAHYLHNLFYLLGATRETSDLPKSVRAELYRAHEIENYDTAAVHCRTEGDVDVYFYGTHASIINYGPDFEIEFEEATLKGIFNQRCNLTMHFKDGSTCSYGKICEFPDLDYFDKLWHLTNSRNNEELVACGTEASKAQAFCAIAAQQSPNEIIPVPPSMLEKHIQHESHVLNIRGFSNQLLECYECYCLPGESRYPILKCPNHIVHIHKDFWIEPQQTRNCSVS